MNIYVKLALLGICTVAAYRFSRYEYVSGPAAILAQVRTEVKPPIQHLACIGDGNRRWAKQRGLPPWEGHKKGIDAAKRVLEFCIEYHIPYLTLYIFSLENFRRTPEEISYLSDLMVQYASSEQEIKNLQDNGIQVRCIGDVSLFAPRAQEAIASIQQKTAQGTKLIVNLLVGYGGQQEIVAMAKKIAQKVAHHELDPRAIDMAVVKDNLWLGDIPEPEIIIRTGYFHRLSNFLSFQSAYSELYFLDFFWPDITKKDLENILINFLKTTRNFGS